jgi:hypothetical protein
MRRWSVSSMFLLGCALVTALAGCGSTGGGGSKAGGGAASDGPPPGGWPQPENGRLTEGMCGLLTNTDYARFGHQRLPSVSVKRSESGANAVDCRYMTEDELALNLQPTSEAAKLVFAAELESHKKRLVSEKRESILATDMVQGADESWFDYWTLGTSAGQFKEHELQVRRGALIVSLTLSGIKGKNEKDPREVLAGLAGLLLKRIPDVGKTDTGVTHKVRYKVSGTGRAKTIRYSDPTGGKLVERKNVPLPWSVELPMASLGRQQVPLTLNALANGLMVAIGCSVSVDGKPVTEQPPRIGGLALCQGKYTETRQ